MQRILSLVISGLVTSTLFAQVVLTESGPWSVPANVTEVTFELVGAGGSGAFNGGGGGGGGAYARGTYTVTPGTNYSIVVGAGGSELATIVGGLGILAGAGANATTVPNPTIGGGGAGGTALGGQVQRAGGNGGGGYWTYFGGGGGGAAGPNANGGPGGNTIAYNGSNCLTPGGTGGAGGGAPGGSGGKGAGFVDNACTVSDPAANGQAYGGGGGGGNGIGSQPGAGAGGVCIITWSGNTGLEAAGTDAWELVNTAFTDRILVRNASGSERYTLLDAAGRIAWSGAHFEEFDLAHLPAGPYVLRVQVEQNIQVRKVLKL